MREKLIIEDSVEKVASRRFWMKISIHIKQLCLSVLY